MPSLVIMTLVLQKGHIHDEAQFIEYVFLFNFPLLTSQPRYSQLKFCASKYAKTKIVIANIVPGLDLRTAAMRILVTHVK